MVGSQGSANRTRFVAIWFCLVIAYAGIRVAVVTLVFRRYGVNPYVFATVELSSSVLYGAGSGRLAGAAVDGDRRAMARWGPVAAVGFLAPDVYVLASGRGMPPTLFLGVIALTGCTAWFSVRGLRHRLRAGRGPTAAARSADPQPPSASARAPERSVTTR